MPSVDDRIVRMEFDNASFERKLGTTLTSLDKLEKSLKFEGAAKGLSNVSQTAGKMNFSGLANSVNGLKDKFKTMSVVGVTALATIASKAVSAGGRIVKSLALDNILAGFHEYETNIGSIQTILANTKSQGTNLEDVNGALDQLNEYSDKTIYNFGQMAKNIGTFTAAGVDLDTSVSSIKGIANLAAISGSSSEQASTAMYQLSQAISTGAVKLQDWNSVVNAGMGGKVFQEALFESGKALGEIKGVKMDQTFQEWTDAGNSFRGSLVKGWVTSDVLTTTLQGFTGEMTESQLVAKGFSEEAAKNMVELGKTGVDAATQVRTLTGLISTTKEAIGSGWSRSFRIVFGDFEEATKLFTNISNAVGEMVGKSADARNELLQGWKDLGGRTLLIETLKKTIKNLGRILKPIKDAFRDIFPPMTSKRLFKLTQNFNEFAKALRPSKDTVKDIGRIFKGFFGILEIGWTAIKGTAKFIKFLFQELTGAGSGNFLDFAAKIGDFFTELNEKLVEGKGIKQFFRDLRKMVKDVSPVIEEIKDKIVIFFSELKKFDIKDIIKNPLPYLNKIKDKLLGLFDGVDLKAPEGLGNVFGRLKTRFETLQRIFGKVKEIWQPFKRAFKKVIEVLDTGWEAIKGWFGELKDKLEKVMKPGDFDAVVDAVNVGLLGGVLVILRRFLKRGIKFNIGDGILENISKSFEQLTGIMKAMQTDIKANALLKIAGAIGILTASVLVLSMIDSAALTKALTAMAIGFGQLMASFAIISKMSSGPKGAGQFTVIATGMILLSTSILILSGAMKVLATMDWEEIGKGLAAIAGLMLIMAAGVKLLNGSGMVRAGVGMLLVATSINILAGAVAIFGTMNWLTIGKGLVGVAGALVAIALGMQLMPKGLALQGVGLLLVATSLNILAGAIAIFGTMDWKTIGKGMVGIAGSLLIIGLAMKLMPPTMPIIGAGLLLVSVALNAIALAMKSMGGMDWGEIAKGLVAMAGALLILALAAHAMQGAIVGVVAITIAAAGLLILSKALEAFAGLSWGDLLKGLIGIAGVLAVLAVSALLIQPAIPALLGLGAALLVVGAGFALFGLGANLVAKAFATFAKVGPEGADAIVASLKAIGKALPAFFAGLAEGLFEIAKIFVKAAPVIAKGLVVLLDHVLDGLIKLLPKALKLLGMLVDGMIDFLIDKIPKFAMMGVKILLGLLRGIRDNIGEIVEVVADIITNFLDALTEKVPEVAESFAEFIRTVISTAILKLNPVTLLFGVGVDVIQGFLDGLDDMFGDVLDWFLGFMGDILDSILEFFGIKSPSTKFFDIGVDLLVGLLNGIKDGAVAVWNWFKDLPGKVIRFIGNVAKTLWQKGGALLTGLWNGAKKKLIQVSVWFSSLPGKAVRAIGNVLKTLWNKGVDFIKGLWDGVKQKWNDLKNWFKELPGKIKDTFGDPLKILLEIGKDILRGAWDGIKWIWAKVKEWFRELPGKIKDSFGDPLLVLLEIGKDIIRGAWNGLKWVWESTDGVRDWFASIPGKITGIFEGAIDWLLEAGKDIFRGLWNGFKEIWGDIWDWIWDKVNKLPGFIKDFFGIGSPSRLMRDIGENVIQGFVDAFRLDKSIESTSRDFVDNARNNFKNSVRAITDELGSIQEFNPRIRPVLDLTSVQSDAKKINGYIQGVNKIVPVLSYKQAQLISTSTNQRPVDTPTSSTGSTEIKFEQTINAPKQLSTNDIYKQTRNQITLAKEELSIL